MQQLFSDKEIRIQAADILSEYGLTAQKAKQASELVNNWWFKNYYGNLGRAYQPTPKYIHSLVDCFVHETIWNVNRAAWWIMNYSLEGSCWLLWDGVGLAGRWLNTHTDIHAVSHIANGFPCLNEHKSALDTPTSENVLAFESLEHVRDPIALVESWGSKPKMLCHRSPFKVRSHGHWNWYKFSGQKYEPDKSGARFSYELRQRGWVLGHNVLDYQRHVNGVPTFFVRP